jgi:hypothetical protein
VEKRGSVIAVNKTVAMRRILGLAWSSTGVLLENKAVPQRARELHGSRARSGYWNVVSVEADDALFPSNRVVSAPDDTTETAIGLGRLYVARQGLLIAKAIARKKVTILI